MIQVNRGANTNSLDLETYSSREKNIPKKNVLSAKLFKVSFRQDFNT